MGVKPHKHGSNENFPDRQKNAFGRLPSKGFTVMDIPVRMRQTRMPPFGIPKGIKCRVNSVNGLPRPPIALRAPRDR
jgi:hypothetical protein